jgi:type II secretory pathway pseudopilin PulG
MPFYRKLAGRGVFSMMELVVVLIVLGVVATIVGPRISRASHAPARTGEPLLVGNLRALRSAIDAFAADHDNRCPWGDAAQVVAQLTQFTDRSGAINVTGSKRYRFGPYLREIPPVTVGSKRGLGTLQLPRDYRQAAWLYDPATGHISANLPNEWDPAGRSYDSY